MKSYSPMKDISPQKGSRYHEQIEKVHFNVLKFYVPLECAIILIDCTHPLINILERMYTFLHHYTRVYNSYYVPFTFQYFWSDDYKKV